MKRMITILAVLILILLPLKFGMADMGTGFQGKYDLNSAAYHTGMTFWVTAFDKHIRAVGQGTWAEDFNSDDYQIGAAAEVFYVPRPENSFDVYVALGPDVDWLSTEYASITYIKAAVGLGLVWQFGETKGNGVYFGYRGKAIGGGENANEARLMVLLKI